jgi:hypothetical protein
MLWEFRIAADSPQEAHDALITMAQVIKGGGVSNIVSFSRYKDPDAAYGVVLATNGAGGLPLTREAFDAAAAASQKNAAPPPVKRTRAPKGTATVIDGPDGEPAAAMEESPFGAPPPDDPQTPTDMRDKAIGLLQQAFTNPAGPPLVRALQTKLKVKKFNEVPDDLCEALLKEAEALHARLAAAA